MSSSNIRYELLKYEFPLCAKEALIVIEQILEKSYNENEFTNKEVNNLTKQLLSEFVFCETSKPCYRRSFGSIQELQLANTIAEYLSSAHNEIAKNYIFLTMFKENNYKKRSRILHILASSAMSTRHISTLEAVSVWLQQAGCASPQALELAEKLVTDQWLLSADQQHLKCLPDTVPQFVANLLATITGLYFKTHLRNIKRPPLKLLNTITTWVYSNPTICLPKWLHSPKLPTGTIPMPAVTPLAGLIHWCCLSPLYLEPEKIETIPWKKSKIEDDESKELQSLVNKNSECELYSLLHFSVLLSLMSAKETQSPAVLNAQDLFALVPAIQSYYHQLFQNGNPKPNINPQLQESMDRIAQTVQLAITNGCVYGNIRNLLASFHTLPVNTLLGIVIERFENINK